MPLAKCARCHKLYEKIMSSVCPKCQEDENKDYDKIRMVLDESPGLNAEQVAKLAEVNIACVLRMLDDGLIANEQVSHSVKCGRCGAPAISISKRLCQACLERLNVEVAHAQASIKITARKEAKLGKSASANVRNVLEDKRRKS